MRTCCVSWHTLSLPVYNHLEDLLYTRSCFVSPGTACHLSDPSVVRTGLVHSRVSVGPCRVMDQA